MFSGPPLVLRWPSLDGPSHAELEPGDPLYGLAAWAYHHADDLDSAARRGLLTALEAAWPRTQGDRKTRDSRRVWAYTAHVRGRSIEDVAEGFGVAPDTVRRWIRDLANEQHETARVETAWAEHGEEPDDPAASMIASRALALSPPQAEAFAEARRAVE